MVEPLEETRYELMFATEPVLSSLDASIPGSSRHPLVELDEIEVSNLRKVLGSKILTQFADTQRNHPDLQRALIHTLFRPAYPQQYLPREHSDKWRSKVSIYLRCGQCLFFSSSSRVTGSFPVLVSPSRSWGQAANQRDGSFLLSMVMLLHTCSALLTI